MKREPKLNLIQIQDRFVLRVNEAYSKWSHRITYHHGWVSGGHYSRARGAAWREAQRDLAKWGLSEEQVEYAIRQAYDVAKVERMYPE